MFHRNFHPCDLTTVHYSTSTSTPCDVWSFTNSVWPPMYLYMYIPMYSNNNNDNNMFRGGPVAYSCLFYRRARTLRCPDGVGTLRIEGFVSSSAGDLKNKPVEKKKVGSVYGRKVVGRSECFWGWWVGIVDGRQVEVGWNIQICLLCKEIFFFSRRSVINASAFNVVRYFAATVKGRRRTLFV